MPKWIEVLIDVPLNQSFTYLAPEKGECKIGMRAEVFFGRRKMPAFIIDVLDELPPDLPVASDKIKQALRLIDGEPVFNRQTVDLARWLSDYYLCSPGEALASMLPNGRRESKTAGDAFIYDETEYTAHNLSEEQQKAVAEICKSFESTQNIQNEETDAPPKNSDAAYGAAQNRQILHYLYGSTGSGKTEVFLTCAEKALKTGKGVIYLVPEIALTKQVTESVIARFGKTAAVLHSGLTPSQKLTEWQRIHRGEARVIIGARSAIFAPVPNLGLIIIDEEHDGSYKSGNTPRYHARQVAIKRCTDLQIPLLMGSATPSAEAWQFIKSGLIVQHTLTRRLAGGKESEIEIVNLSTQKLDGCISVPLMEEIKLAKSQGRQSILFLNRRGFTHFFKCNTCGFELKCKNCSVALTYHKSQGRLRCHYCGWSALPPSCCPKCGSFDVGYSGFGTEFIENELAAKFPDFKTLRVDTDSLTRKGELYEKLSDFKNGKADILLGTQMVAKGLNFPGVKLVGIINADTGLNMPDFRAAERTFALIVQVAGRAGRFFPDGKVIVQSWSPERTAIACACKKDIEKFYDMELSQRKVLQFPPFARLIRLVFRARQDQIAQNASNAAGDLLRRLAPNADILGPAECPIAQISNNYRYQIILRGSRIQPLQKLCKDFFANFKTGNALYIEVDVDPINLL
ncbi:MAG: primosomal protein N' [Treponemataceae bacterium]|nr:primosomal protein N' [Treponemataceae bacterium]